MSDGMFLGIKSSSSWVTGSLDANSSGYNLLTDRLIYWYNGFWLCIFMIAAQAFWSLAALQIPNSHYEKKNWKQARIYLFWVKVSCHNSKNLRLTEIFCESRIIQYK